MRTNYTILYSEGSELPQTIDWPAEPSYDEIKNLVEPIVGGYLEHVTVLYNGRRADMFVNEEGHLLTLPRNDRATEIYRANVLSKRPRLDPESLNWIAGTAIIFHRIVWS